MRLLLAVIAVGICLWTIRSVAAFGTSRLLVKYALRTQNLSVAQWTTQLTPLDAQAHRATAAILRLIGPPAESAREFEQAVAMRPSDYSLWLGLGTIHDRMGNTSAALAALDEAVKRAPFYAQPRWQRGNVLLRAGQYEAAFKDLNLAAQSNPDLIPNLIDLAWSLTRGDAKLTQELVELKTGSMRITYARFLARQGQATEAIAQFRAAGNVPDALRNELVNQLMAKDAYREAWEIWKESTKAGAANEPAATIYDGGFEAPLSLNEVGFGWRVAGDNKTITLSLDPNQPHGGSKSLRIDFAGDAATNSALISQLILVEPSRRYQVNFAVSTHDVVSGGLPRAVVNDASAGHNRLGQSAPVGKGTTDWQTVNFEFTTAADTRAAILSFQRESCATPPCPIFGSILLDSFSVEELK